MEATPAYRGDLRTSRPNRWGHGRRTAATTRPRVNACLWPVGHRGPDELNRGRHQMTDRATLALINS
jgi:hypothetical protein